MADKRINELPAASAVSAADLFVLEQSGVAKKLTGDTLEQWLLALAAGHGGIVSIDKTSSAGLVDEYTITYADSTEQTFTVTNGATGPQGETGATGEPADLVSYETVYQASASGSVMPSGVWSSSVPVVPQGQFLWTRTTLTFNSGDPVVGYSVSYIGVDGAGSGDMRAAVYDPNNDISALPGGIPQYVSIQVPPYELSIPEMDTLSGSAGTNNTIARGNHSHPKDSSKADLETGKVKPDQASSRIITVSADKTIDVSDSGTTQDCINSSDITITIPPETSSLEFAVGTEIEFAIRGSGSVTFAPGTGVTLNSKDGALLAANQYTWVGLKRFASNVWMLNGDLS